MGGLLKRLHYTASVVHPFNCLGEEKKATSSRQSFVAFNHYYHMTKQCSLFKKKVQVLDGLEKNTHHCARPKMLSELMLEHQHYISYWQRRNIFRPSKMLAFEI